jgi:hypothetical protein
LVYEANHLPWRYVTAFTPGTTGAASPKLILLTGLDLRKFKWTCVCVGLHT